MVPEENYRSSARILRATTGLIALNQERLCVLKPEMNRQLHACHAQFCPSAVLPALHRYTPAWHEEAHVAAEVAEALAQSTGTGLVLACRCRLDVLARPLPARGIAFYHNQQFNVLKEEALTISLLRVLSYPAEALQPVPALSAPAQFAVLHLEC